MKKTISVVLSLILISTVAFFLFNKSENVQEVYAETILKREEIPIDSGADGLARLGILKGTENGFELEREVTRGEALTFISRTCNPAFLDVLPHNNFEDIKGHWAENTIIKFFGAGYIHGTSEKTFSPDRAVTGREFMKILLSVMGYENVTIENSYEIGKEAEIISNNFTKSVVYGNMPLLRSDVTRLCRSALTAKCADGERLDKKLIAQGVFKQEDFEGILYGGTPARMNFADRLNKLMPDDENYMFSPISIKMAMMLAANGAEGETLSEILSACDVEDMDKYNLYSENLIKQYANTKNVKLSVANSIWLNKDRSTKSFSDLYKEKIKTFYSGEAEEVSEDDAVDKINSWVYDNTGGKIPTIIQKPDFWAALINAVYFKGNWENEFYKSATYEGDFQNKDNTESKADFMLLEDRFQVYKDDETVMIEIPFADFLRDEKGGVRDDISISMYAVMGGNDYKSGLVESCVKNNKFENKKVELHFPKFKIECSFMMNDILKEMGIKRSFDEYNAQFDRMFDKKDEFNMYIDSVLHKTYIDVDEKGCEAAAVTAVMMSATAMAPQQEEVEIIKFNKPFSFIIFDNTNSEVLFMGEYSFAGKN